MEVINAESDDTITRYVPALRERLEPVGKKGA
jgi:hypothetical protein